MTHSSDLIRKTVVSEVATCCAMNSEEIDGNAWLSEYGIDSVKSLDMILEVEERFNIDFHDEEVAQLVCVNDVVRMVETKLAEGK